MSDHLPPGKTLELLLALKATVEEFAARADKLTGEHRLRLARERQRLEGALQEQAREEAAAGAEAEAGFQRDQAGEQARYEARKTRIGRAYQSSKEQRLKQIEDRLGARKYELQKRTLQAEKDRDSGQATTLAAHQEFSKELGAEQQMLDGLEGAAQRAFRGYGAMTRGFFAAYEKADAAPAGDERALLATGRELLAKAHDDLRTLQQRFGIGLFRWAALWVAVSLAPLALVPVLAQAGYRSFSFVQAGIATVVILVLALTVRQINARRAGPLAAAVSHSLARARRMLQLCTERGEAHHQAELERVRNQFVETTRAADHELKQATADAGQNRVACRLHMDERTVAVTARHERAHSARRQRLEQGHADAAQRLARAAEVRRRAITEDSERRIQEWQAGLDAQWQQMQAEWQERVSGIGAALEQGRQRAKATFVPWETLVVSKWSPPKQFAGAARFGDLEVNLDQLCQTLPKDSRLALPGQSRFTQPLSLTYPEEGSILFETGASGRDQAVGTLNDIILRLLSVAPPGRLVFTIIDPVGLGQNFAGVMHMADYEEQIISSRIWTQPGQIEQKLADLNEHMEKVIQMYLRNEYKTIAEYNEQAGVIAEKYYFLVVADFPNNFTDTAAKRLLSIVSSGPRCGVYTLLHWDQRQPLPQDFLPDELRRNSACVTWKGQRFILGAKPLPGADLSLEAPPPPEQATAFVHQVGRLSRDSSRVEVPFEHVVPPTDQFWSEDTTQELRVPIGRTGATKLQYLAIGKGTCQHGLIAGKTGSGKSTLFHVIITNLAAWCSPEQVEFYLVDFKKGVEFKCYAARHLPHARVVAIESDREFGLSVLQRVDEELKRRGDLFRKLGAQDIAGYKRAGGKEKIPRSLLIIDEFQEFFVEDDKIAQTASLLLDRIVRQGRAFGIHVLLGSQTLGGAYTVARTTLGQMVIRIALQCNEADAYLIMDDENPAPRLLSRPGEGIYNDAAGSIEGNSPFQVVWLPDQVRDHYLAQIRERADRSGTPYPGPIVFEGNAPADVRENAALAAALRAAEAPATTAGRLWLGAPNSIKGPTEALFRRQSGSHLLVVGQREEAVLAMLSLALVALAAQHPAGGVRLVLFDTSTAASPERAFLERLLKALPHEVTLAKPSDLQAILGETHAEMKRRAESPDADTASPIYILIHDLQRFSRLKYEEDFGFSSGDATAEMKPGAMLNDLISEGARLGIHLVATCDTYNNLNRFLSRKAISEFEMRVLFQMSVTDSATLIESPKAGSLGLHRAIFYNMQEGYLETFRPYSLPAEEWLAEVGTLLSARVPVDRK